MKHINFSAIFLGLAVSSCVGAQQTRFVGPSGNTNLTSKCNQSPSACYQQASETCEGPYQVLDSYSKSGGIFADILAGPVTWYYMTYQCGETDGRTPAFPFRGQQYVPPTVIHSPAPVQTPVPVYRSPTTTTCRNYGSSVTCTSAI